ncbi:hypothetical protein FOZ60_012601 [Perkinsus olseni]|uniref:CPW-WPC domain-containing protein n=1 Tax=Perkinsus olseni TaxID=32597 RepID=A0A7J6NB42_PEROL|nr:hypothetical protein FOZ60_012601 [Perkinsus olseni]
MIRLCALTSIVAASHTLDMSRHGDESEISASPGTSGSELGLPFHYPAAADYALGRDLRLDRLQTQQQAVGKHIAAQSRDIRLLFQGGQALASLVSSDNDILSDLIAVSKGHSPGDGTQMENTLSSVLGKCEVFETYFHRSSKATNETALVSFRLLDRKTGARKEMANIVASRITILDGWMYTASGMCSAPPEYAGPCPTLYDLQNHNRCPSHWEGSEQTCSPPPDYSGPCTSFPHPLSIPEKQRLARDCFVNWLPAWLGF